MNKNLPRPHVAIVGNQIDTMIRFRGTLIRHFVAGGAQVTAVCPAGTAHEQAELAQLGAEFRPVVGMRRTGLNPLADMALTAELRRILRAVRPTHQLSYFLKPVIYGTVAGRFAGVGRRVALVEGLGFAFSQGDGADRVKRGIARTLVTGLLRASLTAADHVIVLNRDDAAFLRAKCGVSATKLSTIDGIGIDLTDYAPAPPHAGRLTFTLAARLIREKGVVDFVEAARIVRQAAPDTRFVLLGEPDEGSNALSRADLEGWVREGVVDWPGRVADVRPHLRESSVFVLPSAYGEGLPRSIMEAMAMGRAVITTTAPGCRDSVTEGSSGFVVPPRSPAQLAAAMMRFVDDPGLVSTMGAAAAVEAARRYDAVKLDAAIADLVLGKRVLG